MLRKAVFALSFLLAFMVTSFAAWNGRPIKNPQAFNPSVVNILIAKENGEKGICTGSLFHTQEHNGHQVGFILTAGHCVPNADEMIVVFTSKDRKGYTAISSKTWVRHERLLNPEENGQVLMGDFNAHEIHDVAVIMIDRVPPDAKPLPLLTSYAPKTDDVLYILSRKEEDKFKPMSPFVSIPISNLKHLTMNGLTDVKNDKTSLLFEASIVQPRRRARGICPGDSGGAIVAYKDGKPYTVGTLSAMFNTFSVAKDRQCGRSILYYGVSFNGVWVRKAIEHLLNKSV